MVEESLKLPSSYFRHRYSSTVSKKYKASKPQTRLVRLIKHLSSYPTRLYVGYYTLLALSCIGSAIVIDKSGFAKAIMDQVRYQQRLAREAQYANKSAANFTVDTDIALLITYPDGRRVGDTVEGVRYLEAGSNSVFTTNVIPAVGGLSQPQQTLHLSQPPDGAYSLNVSCRQTGVYVVTIDLTDYTGLNHRQILSTLHCQAKSDNHFQFTLNTQNLPNTTLVRINT